MSYLVPIKKIGVVVFIIWVYWLFYLASIDIVAFWISLIFVPIFGVISWFAVCSSNIVLQVFAGLMFIGHAVGPPFFWLNKKNYGGSGFAAIGDFDFDLGEFFLIYTWVIVLCVFVILCTKTWDIAFLRKSTFSTTLAEKLQSLNKKTSLRRKNTGVYGVFLFSFILFFLLPLTIFMGTYRIGVLGLVGDPLPYHLTGIMYYTRLYLGPLVLIFLFARSGRGWPLVVLIFIYALVAGITSSSRTVLTFSIFPVIYFALIDRKYFTFLLQLFLAQAGFNITTISRDYSYMTDAFNLSEAFSFSWENFMNGRLGLFDVVGGVSNRLYGAQETILAYQYKLADSWMPMVDYFLSGGVSYSVVPNLDMEFYGMDLSGTGLGVGIGVLTYMFIISHSNILTMPFFAAVLGFLISGGNWLLNHFLHLVLNIGFTKNSVVFKPLQISLGGFMAFSLYSSSLNYFYALCQFLVFLFFVTYIIREANKVSKNDDRLSEKRS